MFLTPLLLLLLLPACHAFLIMGQPLVLARMDPIVQPGIVSQHTHAVIGGSAFRPTYDPAAFRAAGCTTMEVPPDNSNYWSPAVFGRNANGSYDALEIREVRAYYFNSGNAAAFPDGLKMVSGNAMSLNATGNAYDGSAYATFNCEQSDQVNSTNQDSMRGFPSYVCHDFLRASIEFPDCWDGVNLDSTDHYAHMARSDGGVCPSSHPVLVAQLTVEFGYQSNAYPADALTLANGDTTGYSLHADFATGWNRTVLQSALDDPTCHARENVFGDGAQCLTLLALANRAASENCTLAGSIPHEQVGVIAPVPQLAGCNKPWASGTKPTCKEDAAVGVGSPSGFVSWGGGRLPVWKGSAIAVTSGAVPRWGARAAHMHGRLDRRSVRRHAHFAASVATVAAVAAL